MKYESPKHELKSALKAIGQRMCEQDGSDDLSQQSLELEHTIEAQQADAVEAFNYRFRNQQRMKNG